MQRDHCFVWDDANDIDAPLDVAISLSTDWCCGSARDALSKLRRDKTTSCALRFIYQTGIIGNFVRDRAALRGRFLGILSKDGVGRGQRRCGRSECGSVARWASEPSAAF
jgi:hypothetical protein